jgi:lysophospholipase L1-like esterase
MGPGPSTPGFLNVGDLTAAHDTDAERETFVPARLADSALKASLGSATVGNRLRRAAHGASRRDGLLPVMATPPTITTGASIPDVALTKAYRVNAGQSNVFRFVGAIPIPGIYATNYQTFYSATKPSGSGGNTPGHSSTSTYGWAVEFYSDAPKVALRALGTSTGYMVEVNDQPVSATVLAQAGTSGTQYMLLDFTSAGGAAIRKFRVEFTQASGWDGAYVGPTYNVWAPGSETNVRVVSVGDSVCASTGNTLPGGHWQSVAAKILGWTDVRQDAWGGSGFTVVGSGTVFGDPLRVADAVVSAPDLLTISATGNDNGQAGVQAAALAAFRAYRTALPAVPIVVTGVDTYPSGTAMTTLQATETAVKAAFDQWADANSWWVPITTDPSGPWQFGSGSTAAPAGNGIADRLSGDGTHPNDLGHQYLGQRFSTAFRTLALPNIS